MLFESIDWDCFFFLSELANPFGSHMSRKLNFVTFISVEALLSAASELGVLALAFGYELFQ